jgi:O-antigen biosynthesis protein
MNSGEAPVVELPLTGERYVPSLQGSACLDHWARYFMAREYAAGKRVLDIACGEGYGSASLSDVALSVTGVDISPEAVAHATHRYTRPNLKFLVGSCSSMPVADETVDLVVSYETLEHHDRHHEMMREIKRVLRSGGLLMMSSPDRLEYSEVDPDNPFHVKELTRCEFIALVKEYFANVAFFSQRVVLGSCIIPEGASAPTVLYTLPDRTHTQPKRHEGISHALFQIALASDSSLPRLVGVFCEKRVGGDAIERIWPAACGDASKSGC